MVETVLILLIQICFVAALCWLVIWVLGQLGIAVPAQVIKILWVIVILVVILLLYRALGPMFGTGRLLH